MSLNPTCDEPNDPLAADARHPVGTADVSSFRSHRERRLKLAIVTSLVARPLGAAISLLILPLFLPSLLPRLPRLRPMLLLH